MNKEHKNKWVAEYLDTENSTDFWRVPFMGDRAKECFDLSLEEAFKRIEKAVAIISRELSIKGIVYRVRNESTGQVILL